MRDRQFSPGFRFSKTDGLVLAAGIPASVAVGLINVWMGVIIAFVVGHFFLFCNIFRISRPLELAWSAIFVVMALFTARSSTTGWPVTLLLSLAVTFVVVAIEMRKPSYHGVFWRRINPGLRDWWDANARV